MDFRKPIAKLQSVTCHIPPLWAKPLFVDDHFHDLNFKVSQHCS